MSFQQTQQAQYFTAGMAGNQTSENTYTLCYDTADYDSADAGQNWANWPSTLDYGPFGIEANYCEFFFAGKHATEPNNKDFKCRIWTKPVGPSTPVCRLELTVTVGDALCGGHPVAGATALTGTWNFGDTIVVDNNSTAYNKYDWADGIATIQIDLTGIAHVFCDFDCDAGSAATSDALCVGRIW